MPNIEKDLRSVVEPETQADPAMKSSVTYTRITSKAVKQALIYEKGYKEEELPSENTIGNMLNRMGYNLKRVLKAKPEKKLNRLTKYLRMYGKPTKDRIMIRNL